MVFFASSNTSTYFIFKKYTLNIMLYQKKVVTLQTQYERENEA